MNLFYLNMNFLKVKQSITLFNVRDVEIEPAVFKEIPAPVIGSTSLYLSAGHRGRISGGKGSFRRCRFCLSWGQVPATE